MLPEQSRDIMSLLERALLAVIAGAPLTHVALSAGTVLELEAKPVAWSPSPLDDPIEASPPMLPVVKSASEALVPKLCT